MGDEADEMHGMKVQRSMPVDLAVPGADEVLVSFWLRARLAISGLQKGPQDDRESWSAKAHDKRPVQSSTARRVNRAG